jgi:hypothetical protein
VVCTLNCFMKFGKRGLYVRTCMGCHTLPPICCHYVTQSDFCGITKKNGARKRRANGAATPAEASTSIPMELATSQALDSVRVSIPLLSYCLSHFYKHSFKPKRRQVHAIFFSLTRKAVSHGPCMPCHGCQWMPARPTLVLVSFIEFARLALSLCVFLT